MTTVEIETTIEVQDGQVISKVPPYLLRVEVQVNVTDEQVKAFKSQGINTAAEIGDHFAAVVLKELQRIVSAYNKEDT
jgi:hypothetical protein